MKKLALALMAALLALFPGPVAAQVYFPYTPTTVEWVSVPYDADNFVGEGCTWAVEAADAVNLRYAVVGKVAFVIGVINNTTTNNASCAALRILLPTQLGTAVSAPSDSYLRYVSSGTTGIGICNSTAESDRLVLRFFTATAAAWPASTNGITLRFSCLVSLP